jgi:hypothetical protein
VIRRNPDQNFSLVDDEVVMLSFASGKYYSLNTIASRIWEEIKENISVSDLIGKLMAVYDVEFEECKEDTIAYLNNLYEKGLLLTGND